MGKRTSETDIYFGMPMWRVEELHKYRLSMILFKYKALFSLGSMADGADDVVTRT